MRYQLDGLDCANCAIKVEQALNKIEGLEDVKVNFATQSVDLPQDTLEKAERVIAETDPHIKLQRITKSKEDLKDTEQRKELKLRICLLLSGALFLVGMIFNQQLRRTPFAIAEYFVLLTSYLLVGWPVIWSALSKLAKRQFFDEDFLMMIATFGAIGIHQLAEAAGVMLFYAIGEYFQNKALNQSRRSISALIDLQPVSANLFIDGEINKVRPEVVKVGQVILVKPGEKVPLDGEVMEGISFVDTSVLTGESIPRKVEMGAAVYSGMVNGQGLLTVKVTKPYQDSSIARILHLVEKAGERKAPTEQFITTFSHYYTPAVVGIATLIALLPPLFFNEATFSQWFSRALILLVISCPCALMISIPLGYFGGIGAASKKGILVKGANFLEALTKVDMVAFDKTGTLTKGVFKVVRVVPSDGYSETEVLEAAARAEIHSNHPIAQSIREAYGIKVNPDLITDYQEIPGYGIRAVVEGKPVLAGNDRLLLRENIQYQTYDFQGTIVNIVMNGIFAGAVLISDEIKEEAAPTISRLKHLGVKQVVMLTGDEQAVASYVANILKIDRFYAKLLPEDKVKLIEEIAFENEREQGRSKGKLAFVGDGINDAPVIARADIGIAMGGLGSDAAIEAADVVLMEDSPSKLADAIEIARYTKKIVKQNISMALGVKLFFIILGSFGVANIWEAVFADVGVTLLAVLNASRTLKYSG